MIFHRQSKVVSFFPLVTENVNAVETTENWGFFSRGLTELA